MESQSYNFEETKYCLTKGIDTTLPSFYFKRKDIHMLCNIYYNEVDPPLLRVYSNFDGALFPIYEENFDDSFELDGEDLANAIINQLQENDSFLNEMGRFVDFMDSHKH